MTAGRLTRPRIEVLYTIHGKPGPPEQELWDVTGYRDSKPLRIGNGASTQHQLDVYSDRYVIYGLLLGGFLTPG